MGLGTDGHFGGNMPGCNFTDKITSFVIEKESEMYKGLLNYTGGLEPSGFVATFGPSTIMQAKKLLMIVNGKEKAKILKELIESSVTNQLPSSILKTHPNFILIADEDAASELEV